MTRTLIALVAALAISGPAAAFSVSGNAHNQTPNSQGNGARPSYNWSFVRVAPPMLGMAYTFGYAGVWIDRTVFGDPQTGWSAPHQDGQMQGNWGD